MPKVTWLNTRSRRTYRLVNAEKIEHDELATATALLGFVNAIDAFHRLQDSDASTCLHGKWHSLDGYQRTEVPRLPRLVPAYQQPATFPRFVLFPTGWQQTGSGTA